MCANCGKAGSNGVKLRNCTACLLVKYYGVGLPAGGPPQAAQEGLQGTCGRTEGRAAVRLGRERPDWDFCPICTLPIPLPMDEHSQFEVCCMKRVCDGCVMAADERGMGDTCPFCRTPTPEDVASQLPLVQKRFDAGDVDAMEFLAGSYHYGHFGLEKNVKRAIELYTEAAELGSNKARFNLGRSYYNGDGVGQDRARPLGTGSVQQ